MVEYAQHQHLNTVADLSEQEANGLPSATAIALLWFEQLKFLNRPQRVIQSKSRNLSKKISSLKILRSPNPSLWWVLGGGLFF